MLKRFSEISMKDVITCGGKGASLGEMMHAGLPIPNGFVLTTKAYGTDSKKWEKEVLEAFDKLNTKFVAVRSSGTKEDGVDDSFAGQFDTYLFVTRENLIEKIKECHDSVNSERIISYCDYKGIDRKSIKVAVVVQKMVNSDSAGVCFTVNPVSQNHDEIMIDAGYGVGEAVVSGMITPDNYIVNKKTGEIKKNISQQEKKLVLSDKGGTEKVEITEDKQSKQKLSDENIKKLSELAVKIENHYGKPMDTEWAVENGELFMLQARPITTLRNKNSELSSDFDLTNFQPELWKNSQIYYNYQGLPFFTSIFELCSSLEESRYSTPILYISKYTDDNKILSYLAGDFIGKGYNMINDLLDQKDDAKIFLAKKNDLVINCIKKCEKYISDKRTDFFNIRDDIQTAFADGRYVCNISYALQDYLNKLKESGNNLFECLQLNISPREEIFLNKAENYLIELVNKNPNDFDIVYKKFMDKFYWFQNSYLGIKPITKDWLFDYYNTLISKKHDTAGMKKPEIPDKYKLLIQAASDAIIYQDNRKKFGLIANVIMDRRLKDISKQTKISYNDLTWLTVDEIKNYDTSTKKGIRDLKDKIYNYKKSGKRFWILTNNTYIDTDENLWLKVQDLNMGKDKGITLKGAIGNKGKYVGIAKIILNIDKDGNKLEKGDVLVTGMTRPEFLPLMQKAGAFITDEGGITCHAAIISRELGKPCIIGTKIATQVLKDGDLVEVDADNGIVKILNNGKKENLKIEILGKIYTPEFWQNPEIFFNYQGVPFYTSVFAKCYSLPVSNRSTPAYYISEFKEGGTIIQYCTGNFIEKGYNIINDLLEGKTEGSEFLAENDKRIVDCFKKCKKYINSDKTNFLDIWRQIEIAFANGWHIFNFSHALQDYLNKLKESDINLYQILSNNIVAPEKTFINKAGDYLKKLVDKYPNDYDVVYENFIKEYGRFQNSYLGVNKNLTKEWLEKYYKSLLESKNKEIEKVGAQNVPEKYKSLVDVAGKAIIYQDNKKKLGLIAYEIMDKRLLSISVKTGIPFEDFLRLTVDEILSYNLDSKDSISELKKKLSKYKKSGVRYGIMIDKGYIDIDKEFWDKVVEINLIKSELKEIKGIVGNKGKIVGRAKIVLSIKKDGNKLKSGDILVTGMTRPEFLPLMQKAGAFVTDEGGITCHAAIVSRELGKPCIIGTKIATQVLKDGDLIEVDADNGIVKILSNDINTLADEKEIIINEFINRKKWYDNNNPDAVFHFSYPGKVFYIHFPYYFYDDFKKEWGGDISVVFSYIINGKAHLFMSIYDGFVSKMIEKFEKKGLNRIKKEVEEIKLSLKKIENDKVLEGQELSYYCNKINTSFALLRDFCAFNQIAPSLDPYITKKLESLGVTKKEVMKYGVDEENGAMAMYQKNVNEFLQWAHKNNINLSDDYKILIKNKDFENKLIGCYKSGYFFHSGYSGVTMRSPEKEFEKIRGTKISKEQQETFDRKRTKEQEKRLKISQYFSYHRDFRKEVQQKVFYYQAGILEKIAKIVGISRDDLEYLQPDEYNTEFFSNIENIKKTIEERKQGYMFIVTTKGKIFLDGNEANDIYAKIFQKDNTEEIAEIHGNTAYKGKYKGKVRIVFDTQKENNFNEGDILVTGMTTPEFVPIIKKSGAIITDAGGVTCHAAIISREFQKPCIVGTKIATQVLKDGDLIEVDADNGIVKIL